LEQIPAESLEQLVDRALSDTKRGLGNLKIELEDKARDFICATADGDARRAYNTLEIAADLALQRSQKYEVGSKKYDKKNHTSYVVPPTSITLEDVESAVQKKALLYDKSGEEHYNVISAFIKSMRGSDPDAAVYYLARMLEAGEDPLFTARRMVIFASEDIGNADPQAVQVAIACMQSFDFVGMPEGWIPLAQCATYLASAPKSNASYASYKRAKKDVMEHGTLPTPKHLRNAPTKLMKEMGYAKDYKYAHDYDKHYVPGEQYLPDKLKGKRYYHPTENGYEKHISERLKYLRAKK